MSTRVVISGLGPVTPFGVGIEPLWSAMCEGRNALGKITRFDPSACTCRIAAEMPAERFDVREFVPKTYRKNLKVMCRDIELALGAAWCALRSAGLATRGNSPEAPATIAPARFGCQIGAGLIASDVDELAAAIVSSRGADGHVDLHHWGAQGMQNLTPLWLLKYLPNMLACHVTIVHDCQGPSNTITCGEASSALSIGEARRIIERGAADACLAGGAEDKLNPLTYLRQELAGRLMRHDGSGDLSGALTPFSDVACGTVVGDGGGLLVLESEASSASRGTSPWACLAGFGASQSCAYDPTTSLAAPDEEAIGEAIDTALRDAGAPASSIDAVVPLGLGVPALDAAERGGLSRVFGPSLEKIPLITLAPFIGDCGAGQTAIAACVAAQALRTQTLPARLASSATRGMNGGSAPSRSAVLRRILCTTTSQSGQNAACVIESL